MVDDPAAVRQTAADGPGTDLGETVLEPGGDDVGWGQLRWFRPNKDAVRTKAC